MKVIDKGQKMPKGEKIVFWGMVFLLFLIFFSILPNALSGPALDEATGNWQIEENGSFRKIGLEDYKEPLAGGTVLIRTSLTKEMLAKGYLLFYSRDLEISGIFDDALIYSYGRKSGLDGKESLLGTYGAGWHMVRLPSYAQEGESLKIILSPKSVQQSFRLPKFYLSSPQEFDLILLDKNRLSLVNSVMLLVFAMGSLPFYRVYAKAYLLPRGLEDLSIYVIITFAWFITRNPWVQFVFSEHIKILKFASNLASMLAFVPFVYIFIRNDAFLYKRQVLILVMLNLIYVLVRLFAYIIFYIDLGQYVLFTQVVGNVLQVLAWIFMILDYRQRRDESLVNIIIYGTLFYLSMSLDQVFDYLTVDRYSYLVSEMGVLLGVLLVSITSFQQAARVHEEKLVMEYYKKLSVTDSLTEMGNRNTFLKKKEEIDQEGLLEQLGVIIMDMNNLKRVNDERGHLEGDRLIVATADMIKTVFDDRFEKFRIGGDEFALLIFGMDLDQLQEKVWTFNSHIARYNESSDLRMDVAVGLAVYDKGMDRNMESIFKRADANMYQRKIRMKM